MLGLRLNLTNNNILREPTKSSLFQFSFYSVIMRDVCMMAASCCGAKKQKLNNSMPAVCCNGTSVHPNGYRNGYTVASAHMCFFCFDVLHSHLHNYEPPKAPSFTNDS